MIQMMFGLSDVVAPHESGSAQDAAPRLAARRKLRRVVVIMEQQTAYQEGADPADYE